MIPRIDPWKLSDAAAAELRAGAPGLAWHERCDAVALVSLRESYRAQRACSTCRSLLTVAAQHAHLDGGGFVCAHLETEAILREKGRREAAERLARQLDIIERQRADLGGQVGDVCRRASAYLSHIPGGMAGQGRSVGAWKAALVLVRGWALPEETALELLVREYAPRCKPSWTERELRGMVRRAGRATQTGYGWLLADRGRAA